MSGGSGALEGIRGALHHFPFCDEDPCKLDCVGRYHFNFTDLQHITDSIKDKCSTLAAPDTRLAVFSPPALTSDACVHIAAKGNWRPTWYPPADVYSRLTAWKFPLLQLAALFPRPPLGKRVELFVFFHLLGDPIRSLQDLIVKFASCQSRALYWKRQFCTNFRSFVGPSDEDSTDFAKFEQHWKAFAIIIDSCDEWGLDHGDYTSQILQDLLQEFKALEQNSIENNGTGKLDTSRRVQIVKSCLRTGKALAADRGTKLFPVFVAVVLFVSAIAIAFIRTSSVGPYSTTVFISIEAYSVAFSATYFWILSLVVLGAAIGSSQTETAIPRILKRLEREINSLLEIPENDKRWIPIVRDDIDEREQNSKSSRRKLNGGIYSCQYNLRGTSNTPIRLNSTHRIQNDIRQYNKILQIAPEFPWVPPYNPLVPFRRNTADIEPRLSLLSAWYTIVFVARAIVELLSYVACWSLYPFWLLHRLFGHPFWLRHRSYGFLVPGSPSFPIWIVFSGLLTGLTISLCVPGELGSCRFVGESGIFFAFLLSWFADKAGPKHKDQLRDPSYANKLLFWYGAKDLLIILITFVWVILTQLGILNSCACYTLWHTRHLILPVSPNVALIVYGRIKTVYPAITFISIFYQLLCVPGLVFWQYFEAWQVFVQRDDKTSNWTWAQRERNIENSAWARFKDVAHHETSEDQRRRTSCYHNHEGMETRIKEAVRNALGYVTQTSTAEPHALPPSHQPYLISMPPSRHITVYAHRDATTGAGSDTSDQHTLNDNIPLESLDSRVDSRRQGGIEQEPESYVSGDVEAVDARLMELDRSGRQDSTGSSSGLSRVLRKEIRPRRTGTG